MGRARGRPRAIQDLEVNDVSRLPWFCKRYPASLPRVELPHELPAATSSTVAVLAGTAEVAPAGPSLPQLGAGLAEGRLHLLAYALGASASG